MTEEFNERFESVEQALKFITDSQAKSEWLKKQDEAKSRARFDEIEENLRRVTQQLHHITKLTGIVFEDLEFQNKKLVEAGDILSKKK